MPTDLPETGIMDAVQHLPSLSLSQPGCQPNTLNTPAAATGEAGGSAPASRRTVLARVVSQVRASRMRMSSARELCCILPEVAAVSMPWLGKDGNIQWRSSERLVCMLHMP